MKKNLLPIVSHEEVTEKTEEKEIDFESCPYCGSPMRIRLVPDRPSNKVYSSGYCRSAYDSVVFICGWCKSTSPIIHLTPQLIDKEKVKELIIREYIECDCDKDGEEEIND